MTFQSVYAVFVVYSPMIPNCTGLSLQQKIRLHYKKILMPSVNGVKTSAKWSTMETKFFTQITK